MLSYILKSSVGIANTIKTVGAIIAALLPGAFLIGFETGTISTQKISNILTRPTIETINYTPQTIITEETIKILMLHSYNPENVCTAAQRQGFLDGIRVLADDYNLNIHDIYMQTKTKYVEDREIQYISNIILDRIEEFDPDYIFTTDDNAFRYVGIELLNDGYRVLSSGLNKPYNLYKEEYDFNEDNLIISPETVRLDFIWELFEKARYVPNHWYILWDGTLTSYYIVQSLEEELKGREKFSLHRITTIPQLRDFLRSIRNKPSSVISTTIYRLYDPDINDHRGGYVEKQDFHDEFDQFNYHHLEFGINRFYSRYGYALSSGVGFYSMGEVLANYLVNVIKRNSEYEHMIMHADVETGANSARLNELNMDYFIRSGYRIIDEICEDH